MKLTNFTDYSLRTLMYLASYTDELCTAKGIANSFGISYNHIVKVVHKLSREGYIKSRKGKGGGISLAREPGDINIGKLVCMLEPDLNIVECFNINENKCNITSACNLKHVFYDAKQAFVAELEKYTLNDVTSNLSELHLLLDSKTNN